MKAGNFIVLGFFFYDCLLAGIYGVLVGLRVLVGVGVAVGVDVGVGGGV